MFSKESSNFFISSLFWQILDIDCVKLGQKLLLTDSVLDSRDSNSQKYLNIDHHKKHGYVVHILISILDWNHKLFDLDLKSFGDKSCSCGDYTKANQYAHKVLLHHEKQGNSWSCGVHGLSFTAHMVGLDCSSCRLKTAFAVVLFIFSVHIMEKFHKSVGPPVLFGCFEVDLSFPNLRKIWFFFARSFCWRRHLMIWVVRKLVLLINLDWDVVWICKLVFWVLGFFKRGVIIWAWNAFSHLRHRNVSHEFWGNWPSFLH